ncbi:MAG: hypothetical protein ACXVB1_10730 [Pseudobdellovibrionaceae bacterium]
MKGLFLLAITSLTQSAFSCVDISGKYLIGNKIGIQYVQKSCDSLTEFWEGGSQFTWLLDGVMRQEGGNPSKWASIIPESNTLHRTNLWGSGTVYKGNSCEWKDLWYSKDVDGNLVESYALDCQMQNGTHQHEKISEKWLLQKN